MQLVKKARRRLPLPGSQPFAPGKVAADAVGIELQMRIAFDVAPRHGRAAVADHAAVAVRRAMVRRGRVGLEARTVDFFQPGEMQPERDHHVLGDKSAPGEYLGRKFRHAWDGGWFSFQMKADAAAKNQLLCTWWGDETGPRQFDILVDEVKIASQRLARDQPGQFWDATYPMPNDLTQGKTNVTVKLQAQPGNYAGGLFGCRILRQQ